MSASEELQKLIYDRLVADPNVHAEIAGRIYDRTPQNVVHPYASFGPADQVEDDDECVTGFVETLQIDVWSQYQGGKREAKRIADAIRKSLHEYAGELTENALFEMRVLTVRHLDDPDGITSHSIVTVESRVETA
ncbi:DUF3168 domain-containing protein [Pseudohoeflea suaedae]|uniref:DUF3168 domain-containing protein n=1 Tax=Pseudohoeflea suaedae TaxID=877384 RepID=A0A4R5PJ90_9HYPH|nr:DUF3168 domain-containing protein [Pseudohoeflea suaedae]TDH35723.1 DUF3168 domain-containing protein [Pseudohoeflea suaedae]